MRVVALLTVRNEELVLARCLEHLHSQGVETCLVDNGSNDRTLEIAEAFRDRGVFRIDRLPFSGCFELSRILAREEQLASEIDADWFIHHDADEIRQAPRPYRTLLEGIADADRQGFSAISFDEFVFLPTTPEESFEGPDYVERMHYYYFFRPRPFHRVNAWKRLSASVNLRDSGGHDVAFEGRRLFPQAFILRHYIALSRAHAFRKYLGRTYSQREVIEHGWHGNRAFVRPRQLVFPPRERLRLLLDENKWDRSDPWLRHEFLGAAPAVGQLVRAAGRPVGQEASAGGVPSGDRQGAEGGLPAMPIIVGMARSGTTLLRQMLNAHPELSIPPQTHFLTSVMQLPGGGDGLRDRFCETVTGFFGAGDFQLSSDEFRKALKAVEPFRISDGLRRFYETYARRHGKSRWGDGAPPYSLHMLQAALPEAHFIYVIRDARDVALSRRGPWSGPGRDVDAEACDWLWRIREARQQAQLCRNYIEIHYEDLVTQTGRVLNTVCRFLDLPYTRELEQFDRTAVERTGEFGGRTNSPDPTRIGRWRREMTDQEKGRFEAIAGSMLRDLGYET